MGRILIPNKQIAMPNSAIFQMPHVGMKGFYRLQTRKAKSGSLQKDTGWFENVITDTGLGYFHTQPHFGTYDARGATYNNVAVGTGSTTPTTSDSSLAAYLASVSAGASGGGTGYANYTSSGYVATDGTNPAYWWARLSYIFPTGAAAGNLTEVGVFPGGTSYAGGLFSRALIVDADGNPTSITVLSDEVLTVTYQTNFYIDLSDTAFSFNLNGSPVTGIYRGYDIDTTPDLNGGLDGLVPTINFYAGDIGIITSGPTTSLTASQSNLHPGTFIQWVNDLSNSGTWYYDYTVTIPTGYGTGTILAISYVHGLLKYQFGNLSTAIVKTSGQQLQMSFRGSWGRYTP